MCIYHYLLNHIAICIFVLNTVKDISVVVVFPYISDYLGTIHSQKYILKFFFGSGVYFN